MANDFTGDSNCVALFKLDDGVLTVDDIGGNTLTDYNTVGGETVDYQEGDGCGDFTRSSSECLYCTDANCDADMPFKEDGGTTISVCCFFKTETSPGTLYLVTKGTGTGPHRGLRLGLNYQSKVFAYIGYSGGYLQEVSSYSNATTDGTWYHLGFTLSGTSYKFRIWDMNTDSLFQELTGTFSNTPTADAAADLVIGAQKQGASASVFYDGLIDEVVIFKDVLTSDEIDEIRAGTFGAVSALSISVSDAITAGESIGKSLPLAGISESESLSIAELIQALLSIRAEVSDSISIGELISILIKLFGIDVADAVSIGEDVSVYLDHWNVSVSDYISISELINLILSTVTYLSVSEAESITISESITAAMQLSGIDIADSIAIGEAISAIMGLAGVDVSDSISIGELIAAIMNNQFAAVESITIGEVIDAVVSAGLVLASDSVSIAELINISMVLIGNLLASTSDSISIAEYTDIQKFIYGRIRMEIIAKTASGTIAAKKPYGGIIAKKPKAEITSKIN